MGFDFIKQAAGITPTQAHFCGWEGLGNLCSALLTGYFKRPVTVAATGEERRDGWSLKLTDTPLSKDELAALLNTLKADDYDWDANDFGEYPIWELSQSVGQKIVAGNLPFHVDAMHAADDGVWFTGKAPSAVARLLIRYPEVDCNPDLLLVPMEGGVTKESVITAFRKAMRFEEPEVCAALPDRISRLLLVTADMELDLNIRISALSIDAEGTING